MLSNRTANFKVNEEPENIKLNNKDILIKQLTTPISEFNINFNFLKEEEKETSSFSFKNDLLDKKVYEFIKSKDDCLAAMELDDSIPNNIEEKKNKKKTRSSKKL